MLGLWAGACLTGAGVAVTLRSRSASPWRHSPHAGGTARASDGGRGGRSPATYPLRRKGQLVHTDLRPSPAAHSSRSGPWPPRPVPVISQPKATLALRVASPLS